MAATAQRLAEQLGEKFVDGGIHPRFGTTNQVLPLTGGMYVELVSVLDHPASDKAPFGQAVRDRSENGGGWMAWVVAVDDLAPVEQLLGREAVHGNRHRPDGYELKWRQIGVKSTQNDPQLPYFIQWVSGPEEHPAAEGGDITLTEIEIAGDPQRVAEWLGQPEDDPLDNVEVHWVAPHGTPGIVAVTFETPEGKVRL